MYDLKHLACFVEVAREGNLADAAKNMHRTQAAVSMTLKQLELQLGGRLFVGERKTQLTPLGNFVLRHAKKVMQEHAHAVNSITHFAKGMRGRVRIAAVPSVASLLLPSILKSTFHQHQDIHLQVRDLSSKEIITAVNAREVDFGIASLAEKTDNLESRLLATEPFGCICHEHHPLTQVKHPLSWKELEKHSFIANLLSNQINAPQVQLLNSNARMQIHNTTSLLAFVKQDYGITLLPKITSMLMPQLCFLPLQSSIATRQLFLIRIARSHLSPVAEQLLRLLEQQIPLKLTQLLRD